MAASNFDRALALVLKNEGGFVNDRRDPGGATNLGITRATLARARGRAVAADDVKRLGRGEAAAIYRRSYWDPVRGDDLPAGLDLAVFDLAVNSGPARAARALQRVLGCTEDGLVGAATLAAAAHCDVGQTLSALSRERLAFLRRLPTWPVFGRGWARRVSVVEKAALACIDREAPSARPSVPGIAPRPAAAGGFRTLLRAIFRWVARPPAPFNQETSMSSPVPTILFDLLAGAIAKASHDPKVALGPERARQVTELVKRSVQADSRLQRLQETPDAKPWWQSTTIWGAAISASLKALAIAFPGQIDPAWAEPIQQLILLAASFVGDGLAIFGRLKAKQPIG
jgi:lysozyme family protein